MDLLDLNEFPKLQKKTKKEKYKNKPIHFRNPSESISIDSMFTNWPGFFQYEEAFQTAPWYFSLLTITGFYNNYSITTNLLQLITKCKKKFKNLKIKDEKIKNKKWKNTRRKIKNSNQCTFNANNLNSFHYYTPWKRQKMKAWTFKEKVTFVQMRHFLL